MLAPGLLDVTVVTNWQLQQNLYAEILSGGGEEFSWTQG